MTSAFAMGFSACSARTTSMPSSAAPSLIASHMRKAGRKACGSSMRARRMAVRNSTLALGCLLLGACAAMSENECRTADWYQIGYRDADPYGLRPQIDRYSYECRAWLQAASEKI